MTGQPAPPNEPHSETKVNKRSQWLIRPCFCAGYVRGIG